MKKSLIVIAAGLVMAGLFVFGMNWYKTQQAETISQVAMESDSPFNRPDAPMIGTIMAKVEIVEFFDPACEGCRAFHAYVKNVLDTNKNQVRLSLRYATLHRGSDQVAQLLEAARMQGMEVYRKTLEAVLEAQPIWADHRTPQPQLVWTVLDGTGLDIGRAKRDMNDPRVLARLQQDAADMVKLNVRQTPTFFINGKPLLDFSPDGLATQVANEVRTYYKP